MKCGEATGGALWGEGTLVIPQSFSRSVSMTQPPPSAGQS